MNSKVIVTLLIALVLGGGYAVYTFLGGEEPTPQPKPKPAPVDDVEVIKPTTQPAKREIRPEPPKSDTKDSGAPLLAEVGPESQVLGRVIDERGKPVEGADITLFQYRPKPPNMGDGKFKVGFDEDTKNTVQSLADGSYKFDVDGSVTGRFLSMRLRKSGFVTMIKDHIGPGMVVDFHVQAGGEVVGTVTDRDTGEPIPNVSVEANFKNEGASMHDYLRWRESTRTDASGKYRFEGAPLGDLSFLLEHEDYEQFFAGLQEKFTVQPGPANDFSFQLKKGLVFEGIVVDINTKKPVNRATVVLRDSIILPSDRQTTGEFGKFRMTGVKRGGHPIEIDASGYTKFIDSVEFSDENMKAPMVFELRPAGTASGTVVDSSGAPIAGADIYVAEKKSIFHMVRDFAEVKTDAQGRFVVSKLNDKSKYKIAAKADGTTIGASEEFEAITGDNVNDVIVRLDVGARIQGRILDEVGAPIKDVKVSIEQPPFGDVWFQPGLPIGQTATFALQTDASGVFAIDGLHTGTYFVTPEHPDYIEVQQRKFQIASANESVNQDFTLKLGHRITGSVRDQYGAPVKGAVVSAGQQFNDNKKITAITDADGNYALLRLEEKPYRLKAESPKGAAPALQDVPSDSSGIDFILLEYGKLSGRVVSREDGRPITKFSVRVSPILEDMSKEKRGDDARLAEKLRRTHETFKQSAFVSNDGEFVVEKVEPGEYEVEILCETHREVSQMSIRVNPGQTTELQPFVLTEGARFEGYIKDSSGAPITGKRIQIRVNAAPGSVLVTALDQDGRPVTRRDVANWEGRDATTNEDGFFSIGGLPPGSVRVMFTSAEFCVTPPFDRAFGASGTTREDFTFKRAAKGIIRVRDENGDGVNTPTAHVLNLDGTPAQVDGHPVYGRGDPTGNLRIEKMEPGTYRVQIRRHGYQLKEIELSVQEGEESLADVTLDTLR